MTVRTAACAFYCLNIVQTGANARDTELETGVWRGVRIRYADHCCRQCLARVPKQEDYFQGPDRPNFPDNYHLGALGVYIYIFDIHFRRFLWIASLLTTLRDSRSRSGESLHSVLYRRASDGSFLPASILEDGLPNQTCCAFPKSVVI